MPHARNSKYLETLKKVNHRHVPSSLSTNSELIEAIKTHSLSADQPHLLTADTQTAGRGQRGRSWQSPAGNVYLSLYHPVTIPISGLLSLIIGVELAKMPVIRACNKQLMAQGLTPIGVKWANDLGFYNTLATSDRPVAIDTHDSADKPKNSAEQIIYFSKLAGILIEPVWQAGKLVGIVMGVGLNVQATPKLTTQTLEGMSYQALSLQDITTILSAKMDDDSQKSLADSLLNLTELYVQISQALIDALKGFESIAKEQLAEQTSAMQTRTQQTSASKSFMKEFDQLDALAGLRIQVSQNHNGNVQIITGFADGIDTNGCLQLRQDNGKLATLFTGRIDVINNS
ncbi:MAG: biotin--[acetyl-CoA-carboxylase] ligase [Psychrobacter sp.]|nr:biotin--[acetyl-CoA-carboxylase] ligase [Psychrobacter sp.]